MVCVGVGGNCHSHTAAFAAQAALGSGELQHIDVSGQVARQASQPAEAGGLVALAAALPRAGAFGAHVHAAFFSNAYSGQ